MNDNDYANLIISSAVEMNYSDYIGQIKGYYDRIEEVNKLKNILVFPNTCSECVFFADKNCAVVGAEVINPDKKPAGCPVFKVKKEAIKNQIFLEIYNNNLSKVQELIESGEDIEAKRYNGETPLHLAFRLCKRDIVKYLVSKGADVNAMRNDGETPLHVATYNSDIDSVKYLIENGADVNIGDNNGITPLYDAVISNWENGVKYLIENGADVNMKAGGDNSVPKHVSIRYNGRTPLHVAVIYNNIEMVKLLISAGANINQKDGKWMLPIDWARRRGHKEIYKILKEVQK